MNPQSMTVARRLAFGFGLAIGALALMAFISINSIQWLKVELSNMGTKDMPMTTKAGEIDGNLMDSAIEYEKVLRYSYALQAQEPDAKADFTASVKLFEAIVLQSDRTFVDIRALLMRAKDNPDADVVATYANLEHRLESIDKDQTAFETLVREVFSRVEAGQYEEARQLIGAVEAAQVKAEEDIAGFIGAVSKVVSANVAKDEAGAASRTLITGLLVAVAMLATVASAWRITRSLLVQLGGEPGTAAALAGSVAQGDLTIHVPVKHGDTTSLMAQLKVMQDNLANLVSGVRTNAESVASASAQIAQGNAELSQRTEEQASALEETAASMEQLGSTVKQNADNVHQANQLAQSASGVATQGGQVVGEVVETMRGINDSSRRIADIIGVIDGIAFQTNILALNAAVEAARAGEQGRGFAVVAGEVRSLAQRSAAAAKDIKDLINASMERVEQGTALVEQTRQTMDEVVGSIHRVTDIMGEISAASAEQSAGVSQVGQAVSQMDQTTQQNAALVEESAAAAESLKAQASALLQAVGVFKLTDMDARRAAPLAPVHPARDAAKGHSPAHKKPAKRPPAVATSAAMLPPTAHATGAQPALVAQKADANEAWTSF